MEQLKLPPQTSDIFLATYYIFGFGYSQLPEPWITCKRNGNPIIVAIFPGGRGCGISVSILLAIWQILRYGERFSICSSPSSV
jgi:hypothetical protein